MDARPVAIGVNVYGQSATMEDASMMETKSASDVLTSQTFWLAVIRDTIGNIVYAAQTPQTLCAYQYAQAIQMTLHNLSVRIHMHWAQHLRCTMHGVQQEKKQYHIPAHVVSQ